MSEKHGKPFYKSITNALILIIVLFYLYNLIVNKDQAITGATPYQMIDVGALSHTSSLWTFIISLFVHVSFNHFIINIIMLGILGHVIENEFNNYIYMAMFFIGGLLGNIIGYLLSDTAVISGASGSIYSLLGGFAALLIINKTINFRTNKTLIILLLLTIMIGITYTAIGEGINIMAHLIGLIWGFALPIFIYIIGNIKQYILKQTKY
ncbi:rhomboid family intramembrane serine protease [Staphylococcus shinii]|uniref:rhomboid family intramembrane serine protease n=1 Tax=Staphylococcus shinii TaxID=2912228 RepID=UPI003EEC079D